MGQSVLAKVGRPGLLREARRTERMRQRRELFTLRAIAVGWKQGTRNAQMNTTNHLLLSHPDRIQLARGLRERAHHPGARPGHIKRLLII